MYVYSSITDDALYMGTRDTYAEIIAEGRRIAAKRKTPITLKYSRNNEIIRKITIDPPAEFNHPQLDEYDEMEAKMKGYKLRP